MDAGLLPMMSLTVQHNKGTVQHNSQGYGGLRRIARQLHMVVGQPVLDEHTGLPKMPFTSEYQPSCTGYHSRSERNKWQAR